MATKHLLAFAGMALGLTLAVRPASAQTFTLSSYEIMRGGAITVTDPPECPENMLCRVTDAEAQRVGRFSVGAAIPVSLMGGRLRVVNGLRYEGLGLAYEGHFSGGVAPGTLHYIRYDLTLIQQLPRRWSLTAYVAPGLASEFEEGISTDDLHMRVGVLVSRSGQVVYGLGATYRDKVSSPLLPVLQLHGPIGTRARLDVLLPGHAQVWHRAGTARNWEVGALVRFATTPYNLHYDVEENSDAGLSPQVEHSIAAVGLATTIRLAGPFHLGIEAGRTLWNKLRLSYSGGDRDYTFEPSFYLRGAVLLHSPLP